MGEFHFGEKIEALLAPRSLWAILWGGLALLTIALLVLMRTRWGQARPLSKCAVLSLFAHLLLMGYASMTQLFSPGVPPRGDGTIEIDVVSEQPADQPSRRDTTPDTDVAPWERLAVDTPSVDESPRLERREFPHDAPTPQASDSPPVPIAAHLPTTLPPTEDVITEVPEQAASSSPGMSHFPIVEAAKIESPQPRKSRPAAVVTPQPTQLARLSTDVAPHTPPRRDLADNVPRDQDIMTDRLQRLAQVPAEFESADAVFAHADQTAQSTNKANTNWQSVVPSNTMASQTPVEAAANQPQGGINASTPQAMSIGELVKVSTPAAGAAAAAIAVARVASASEPLASSYQNRMRSDREQIAQQRGGTEDTEAAVRAALRWLASVQNDDGHWDARAHGGGAERIVAGEDRKGAGTRADTGITGLALLAFLAAGETHVKGQYREQVQHGLEFLLRQQASDGNLAGNATSFARMYCHGMATLAVSEAYAMTGDERIRPYLVRAIAYTVSAQNLTDGGWRYHPGDRGDMSQFGWQVMALKSAESAGIAVPQNTRHLMQRFLAGCGTGRQGGLAGYRTGEPATRTMTAEALVCRIFLHDNLNALAANEAADYMVEELPGDGRTNLYYWYYGTLALFHLQDERWDRWNRALQRQLLRNQRSDETLAGSWDPNTVWGGCGGRVYTTAMATLCLEVYYRYLPLYERGGARQP